ncbi:MAG: aminotransferase class V-fold PLP-dependent enzyme, partial [Chloroflexi bacterium]|nr:aminotransferase class V-fold PLP-dependent enzyme [Chloroflexota bacterium]
MSPISMEQVRAEFPVAQSYRYLDSGYNGILPLRAARAMSEYVEKWCQTPLPGGDFGDWLKEADDVRRKVATLLGVSPEEIFFTRGTTDGIQVVATSVLKPGDELLAGGLEHPADYAIWTHLANRGVRVRIVPHRDGHIAVEDLASAVRPETRAIGLCLVNTYNGYRQDLTSLNDLCEQRDLYLFLDGIQALGAVNVELSFPRVSVLSAATHKWLCTPRGMGVAYVNRRIVESAIPGGVWFPNVHPTADGSWGPFIRRMIDAGQQSLGPQTIEPGTLTYAPTAKRFESGPSFLTIAGLGAMV